MPRVAVLVMMIGAMAAALIRIQRAAILALAAAMPAFVMLMLTLGDQAVSSMHVPRREQADPFVDHGSS
jgi:hypothetical protein